MKMKRRVLQRDKPVQKRSKDTATRELIKNSIRALDGEGNERKFRTVSKILGNVNT